MGRFGSVNSAGKVWPSLALEVVTLGSASLPYGVSFFLKAVGEVKVPWIDDHSLELRYRNEHSLRAVIGQVVEYMIDQRI